MIWSRCLNVIFCSFFFNIFLTVQSSYQLIHLFQFSSGHQHMSKPFGNNWYFSKSKLWGSLPNYLHIYKGKIYIYIKVICWKCNWNHIFLALFINLNIFKSSLRIAELEIAGAALPAGIETHCHPVARRCRCIPPLFVANNGVTEDHPSSDRGAVIAGRGVMLERGVCPETGFRYQETKEVSCHPFFQEYSTALGLLRRKLLCAQYKGGGSWRKHLRC